MFLNYFAFQQSHYMTLISPAFRPDLQQMVEYEIYKLYKLRIILTKVQYIVLVQSRSKFSETIQMKTLNVLTINLNPKFKRCQRTNEYKIHVSIISICKIVMEAIILFRKIQIITPEKDISKSA